MSPNPNGTLGRRLENLERKADLQTTAHAWLRDHYQFQNSVLTLTSVLAGVGLVSLVLVSPTYAQAATGIPSDVYQALVACLAILNFSIVVILLAWRLDVRASEHGRAVRHFTDAGQKLREALRSPQGPTEQQVAALEERYLDTADMPRIPEDRFLQLKQWHLTKVQISQELDRNPYESLRKIRKRLRSAVTAPNRGPPETR